jgi:gliding motility-associated protein GldM
MHHRKFLRSGLMALFCLSLSACFLQEEGGILKGFQTNREQLTQAVLISQQQNAGFRDQLLRALQDSVGEIEGAKGRQGIHTLQNLTHNVFKELRKNEEALNQFGVYSQETGKLENMAESRASVAYWLDEGHAAELQKALEGYGRQLDRLYTEHIAPQAPEAGSIGQFFAQGERENWSQNYFSGPLIAQLSMLEGLKLKVLQKEWEMLNQFNSLVGVATFQPNMVMIMDNPISRTIVAGGVYSTQLSVGLTSNAINPEFSSESGSIRLGDSPSTIFLNIPADGEVIPEGAREGVQRYTATARVPLPNGSFQLIPTEGQFTVRKPEVVMRSETIQILYQYCGNDFFITVPALGDSYHPVISASEAEVIPSKKYATKFRIVPTGENCRVSVSSNTNGQIIKVGDVDYKVVQPPKPTIELSINGKTNSGVVPVSANSRVQVRVVPDADFKANLPDDARYTISSIDVLAQLSLGPPVKVNALNTNGKDATQAIMVSLGTQVRNARRGTKVYIRINDIYRHNFQNKRVPQPLGEAERMLSIVLR